MLTVSEAAVRAGRDPETIRRWIRTGRLRARKIGMQHVIEEEDLQPLLDDEILGLPPEWGTTITGEAMPNVVRALRLSRTGH